MRDSGQSHHAGTEVAFNPASSVPMDAISNRYREPIMPTPEAGASLPSLLLALTLTSATALYAVDGARRWLDARHAEADRQALAGLIERARLQSLLEGRRLRLCASADAERCAERWERGALLLDPVSGQMISAFTPRARITLHGPATALDFSAHPAASVLNATFTLCTPLRQGWQLVLNRVGRPRMDWVERDQRCSTQ
ncbi:hypothetical protein A5892_19120 [Halotalea alkalilenta]|uniref:General secretion pathway GspH domain-containing protein n=2 Tax=Halotalea alkalilenta TaxID=376489 RepID=A0A172YJZ4_9GAMM|nr:hypothetical protein A5892_19120 [Halotalea alkalilenta]